MKVKQFFFKNLQILLYLEIIQSKRMFKIFTSTQQKRKIQKPMSARKYHNISTITEKNVKKYHLPHTKVKDINFQKFAIFTT